MKISSKTHRLYRLQQVIFYILLSLAILLLAKFSLQTNNSWDWTQNSRHTLSNTSRDFLQQLNTTIDIQIFISPNNEYRAVVEALINRYQEQTNHLNISFINPDFSPDLVRELKIQQQGEIVVSKAEKLEHLFDLSEQSLTNALISVSREQEQWLVFIEGHGERTPLNQANFNLSTWGAQLKQKGFQFQALNLVEHSQIPTNAAAVIIASPETAWLPGEIELIRNYIDHGGNLLWLTEPNTNQFLIALAEQLDIEFVAGTVMDPNAELLGITDPQFILVTDYANHPIGSATNSVTLFPQAVAMEHTNVASDWQHTALLTTQDNTWSETTVEPQQTSADFNYDVNEDTSGPLVLGYLLTRLHANDDDKEQRIAIIGDGDFVSNTYIGNAANLDFSIALINWLVQDDELIAIPVKTTLDSQLDLSRSESLIIGLGFLLVIPSILLSVGFGLWWYRRRQ
ncbi:mucin 2 [Methylophaga sp. 42_25_T18]|nr:mucin 2 [Methylophaga sp. 42_25_T18]OUR89789.1 mucin 2 [Methylophaga sp. 42_8_T64]